MVVVIVVVVVVVEVMFVHGILQMRKSGVVDW